MWAKVKNREFYTILGAGLLMMIAYLVVLLFFRDWTQPHHILRVFHVPYVAFFAYGIRFVKENGGDRLIDKKFALPAIVLVVAVTLWIQEQYPYFGDRPVWLYFLPNALFLLIGLTTLIKLKWFSRKTE